MDKLHTLLKEHWSTLTELFDLPSKIDTQSLGDEFFRRGEYGDHFEFFHTFPGKSGKNHRMTFQFDLRSGPSFPQKGNDNSDPDVEAPTPTKESQAPIYEVSFFPTHAGDSDHQYQLLNDLDPTAVFAVAGYFIFFHASKLASQPVPVPYIKYVFRPYKEDHEKSIDAADSKRGAFYSRAIPRAMDTLSHNFPTIHVTDIKTEPAYTLISVRLGR